ncbi:MAG: MFS transporter [Anaerolineae bacterium]|jgi:GPH family glycoside/pentoside/hexuronide:cation symporter
MPTTDTAQFISRSDKRLSFWTKAAYAVGDLGNSVGVGTVIPFWYTIFLTDIVRLDLRLVSLFWAIVTVWDAINDPLFGFLSDRTRTRWGRRRPYLLFGALPFGVAFILLWVIPPTHNQVLLFVYYTAIYILFEGVYTAVNCPYVALTPELTQDHDERTSLVTYRMAVSIGAGLAAPLLFALVIFPMFPGRDPRAYQTIGLICGLSFILPLWITFLGTRENPNSQQEDAPSLREAVRFVLRNVPFRYVLSISILSWMPVVVAQAVFAYYFIYWIGMTEDETSLVQVAILGLALLFLPVVLWLARRLEKKTAYIIAAATWVVVMLTILVIPQGAKVLAFILAPLTGFGVAAAHLLPSAMMPDVLEVDELMSGRRQEGVYMGLAVFVSKLAHTVVLALIPAVLRWSGYIQPTSQNLTPSQPAAALNALRLLLAILPVLLLVASIVVTWFYPLTRQRHAEIRRELEVRRG